jgi:hypothetical protein
VPPVSPSPARSRQSSSTASLSALSATVTDGHRRRDPNDGVAAPGSARDGAGSVPAMAGRRWAGTNHTQTAARSAASRSRELPGRQPIVLGQCGGEQPEGLGVASLVLADAIDRRVAARGRRELHQAPVGQLGARLQGDVELAVAMKGLVASSSRRMGDT